MRRDFGNAASLRIRRSHHQRAPVKPRLPKKGVLRLRLHCCEFTEFSVHGILVKRMRSSSQSLTLFLKSIFMSGKSVRGFSSRSFSFRFAHSDAVKSFDTPCSPI